MLPLPANRYPHQCVHACDPSFLTPACSASHSHPESCQVRYMTLQVPPLLRIVVRPRGAPRPLGAPAPAMRRPSLARAPPPGLMCRGERHRGERHCSMMGYFTRASLVPSRPTLLPPQSKWHPRFYCFACCAARLHWQAEMLGGRLGSPQSPRCPVQG